MATQLSVYIKTILFGEFYDMWITFQGVGDGQGSLVCYSPWGGKESDRTERLNWKICLQNQTHMGSLASLSKDGGNSKTHCTLNILLEYYRYFKKCMYAWIQNILMYKSGFFFDLSETILRKLKIKFVQVIWYHGRVTWCSPFIMLNFYNIWITHWACKVVVLFCWTIFKY